MHSQQLSQNAPACIQCGGTDYILESGYYFCAECQVQSQDIREQVFEEYVVGQFKGRRISVPASKSQEPAAERSDAPGIQGLEFTSWEAFNLILQGSVNELILLGAPKELKIVTLQLWALYLMKVEAAFLSKEIEKKPRLDLNFRRRDAQLVYGTDYNVIKAQKRPVTHRKRPPPSRSSKSRSKDSFSSKRSGKIRLALKKKKLASAEYAASTSQLSEQSELTIEDLNSRSASEKSFESYKSNRLKYTKKAYKSLLDLMDTAEVVEGGDRAYLQKRVLGRHSKSVEHITIKKLLAILRIALLILDSDIHLGDLLRWCEEGYLSIFNAEKLIPSNVTLTKDIKSIFITHLNSRETINKDVFHVVNFLGIYELKSRILPLIQRYLKELCLPSDMYSLISKLIGLKPPALTLNSTVNYEARALAFILFILKFLFGLDGATEENISNVARVVNKDRKDSRKLFDWHAWMQYINCRNSVISFYNQGTRDFYHPSSIFGGPNPFLAQWEKVPSKHTIPRKHIIDKNLAEVLTRFVKELSKESGEPLPPSLEPNSTMLEIILKTKNLPLRTRNILEQNFTYDTIEYLINPDIQKHICDNYGFSMDNKLAATFVIVKPLGGVANNSSVNPALNAKKNVKIRIVEEFPSKQGQSTKMQNRIESQKNILVNKKNVISNIAEFCTGEKIKYTETSGEKSWSSAGRGYWLYHTSATNKNVQSGTFNHLTEAVFHPDFHWLLREASRVGHVTPRELYRELTKVELMYLKKIKAVSNKWQQQLRGSW